MKEAKVNAFGRLHFGLVNLSEVGEYMNGGAGAMISPPVFSVTASNSSKFIVSPIQYEEEVRDLCRCLNVTSGLNVRVDLDARMCQHVGLGFHTQLRLAIATAILFALDLNIDTVSLSKTVMRGGTSGIGSLGFWFGGLIFDRGRKRTAIDNLFLPSSMTKDYDISPLVYHKNKLPFCLVIVKPAFWENIYGEKEKDLFEKLTPIPESEAHKCSALIFGDLKQAVDREDFNGFCQTLDGMSFAGFKKREIAYRGERLAEIFELMRKSGLSGVGMSSWGPICFGFILNQEDAESVAQRLKCHTLIEDAWVAEFATGATVQIDNGDVVSVLEKATFRGCEF
ncbi:beta-ribofuranosylaminobenzene 5'-phosphate synthase family protein [Pseudomonas sp. GXZC]|uniref:beta-ribofuranosylaminobenzene 5'-phosphate synthase family protein n=1 Tax=Pseudomonas sp. GXZC TaxID=3003351 RepID=UPI0022AA2CAC|nr:beta-ribofuranosylaminobenzene 5'-phosphate synthase family protein [Pseudomonas sp. GXZC]WAT27706.1 hypothetical protein OZ428_27665 [Pseudomonas sp. GXZC]